MSSEFRVLVLTMPHGQNGRLKYWYGGDVLIPFGLEDSARIEWHKYGRRKVRKDAARPNELGIR